MRASEASERASESERSERSKPSEARICEPAIGCWVLRGGVWVWGLGLCAIRCVCCTLCALYVACAFVVCATRCAHTKKIEYILFFHPKTLNPLSPPLPPTPHPHPYPLTTTGTYTQVRTTTKKKNREPLRGIEPRILVSKTNGITVSPQRHDRHY